MKSNDITTWSMKTCLITGANRGIGLAATKQLAESGDWKIIAACRSTERAEKAIFGKLSSSAQSNVEILKLDLEDLDQIKLFCNDWKKSKQKLDVLVCNAGIQLSGGTGSTTPSAAKRTKNGYESTVGTNHIGHFVLVNNMLKSNSINSKNGRIVWIGSGVHNPDEPGGDVGTKATLGNMKGLENGFLDPETMINGESYNTDKAYKDSKLCNVVTSLELARRLLSNRSKITSNVMNPGLIPTTGLFRDLNPFFVAIFTFITRYIAKVAVDETEGGRRLSFMVESPTLDGVTGTYYSGKPGVEEFKPISPSTEASKEVTGKKLWTFTEKLVSKYYI